MKGKAKGKRKSWATGGQGKRGTGKQGEARKIIARSARRCQGTWRAMAARREDDKGRAGLEKEGRASEAMRCPYKRRVMAARREEGKGRQG
jgi:hypothetical protein